MLFADEGIKKRCGVPAVNGLNPPMSECFIKYENDDAERKKKKEKPKELIHSLEDVLFE